MSKQINSNEIQISHQEQLNFQQLKPFSLLNPDFNYYSRILYPYNYPDAHSVYTTLDVYTTLYI